MPGTLEIVTGLAGSGKTARLLETCRAHFRSQSPLTGVRSCLWLTPTQRARDFLLTQLLDDRLVGCLTPQILTFDNFADEILLQAHEQIVPISKAAKRSLLRHIINDLKRDKKLPYFFRIVETSGFLDLVSSFISELKRDETWPEVFLEACRAAGSQFHRRDEELGLIYEAYQEHLLRLGCYDTEGRFWSARTVIEAGQLGRFASLSLVIVDGFSDLTQTQNEILQHLSHTVNRVIVSLPCESPIRREELFTKVARQLRQMERIGDSANITRVKRVHLEPAETNAEALPIAKTMQQISRHLFDHARSFPKADSAEGVEILAVTGEIGEVQILAERVKRLLLSGVPAEEIIIVFRSLNDRLDLFQEIWSAAGLPFWCDAGGSLARSPILRALFAVLQMEAEDWAFDRLMAVLDSNYFSPDRDSSDGDRSARTISRRLRQKRIPAQRIVILKSLERDAWRESEAGESLNFQPAYELLSRLSELTADLRKRHTFPGWVDTVIHLAGQIGLSSHSDPESTSSEEDQRAWQQFVQALEDAVQAEEFIETKARKVDLSAFMRRLNDLLRSEILSPTGTDRGCVRVVDAQQVRNLDVPYLFLAGLSENSFPNPGASESFYNDFERSQLNDHGLSLGNHTLHNQEEMLLFYRVVTRARTRLILSYPAVGPAGEPLFPSPYLTALKELFTPEALPTQQLGQLDPLPEHNRILTDADWRVVATHEVRQHRPALFRTLLQTPTMNATGRNVLAAMEMAAARFQTRGFTRYEGRLLQARHRQSLQQKFPHDYQFSATQLELFAKCPFRFYLEQVLKIEPMNSVELATDYIGRGVLVHQILTDLHRQLDDTIAPGPPTGSELTARFLDRVNQELDKRNHESELHSALTEIERDLLSEWGTAYGEQWDAYQGTFAELWESPPVPILLEAGFGELPDDPSAHPDAFPTLTLGTEEQQTNIQGRIDRIDVGQQNGQRVYNVIDYKTGMPPRFNELDLQSGRALQLAIYILAVRKLELLGDDLAPFQMAYWSLKEDGFVTGLKGGRAKLKGLETDAVTELEALLDFLVPALARQIREGQFHVYNSDPHCTGPCPFNTVCRVNQIRPLERSMAKHPRGVAGE